ncbi:hypothetical protein GNI_102130, partial [Gregarina niphandrodes]
MDVVALEDTLDLSDNIRDAVQYLTNSCSLNSLIVHTLFPSNRIMDSRPLGSGSSSSCSSSIENDWKSSLLVAAGSGVKDNGSPPSSSRGMLRAVVGDGDSRAKHCSNNVSNVTTVLQILRENVSGFMQKVIDRCKKANDPQANELLIAWIGRSTWRVNDDPILAGQTFPAICNTHKDAEMLSAKMLVAHCRKTGMSEVAGKILEWLRTTGSQDRSDEEPVITVLDPQRMAVCLVVELINALGWDPKYKKLIHLTDKELVKPILSILNENDAAAAHVCAQLNLLPRFTAKLILKQKSARKDDAPTVLIDEGIDTVLDLIIPASASLTTLCTSILNTCSSQWWESHDNLLTLADLVSTRRPTVPFVPLLKAVLLEDFDQLDIAIEEAFFLYALSEVMGVSFEPRRRAAMTPIEMASEMTGVTSAAWSRQLLNWVWSKGIQTLGICTPTTARLKCLVVQTATAMQEVSLLAAAVNSSSLPPRVLWKALLQAARNSFDSAPPSLGRYVSPELLTEGGARVAHAMTVFDFWWNGLFQEPGRWSLLARNRMLLAEYGVLHINSCTQSTVRPWDDSVIRLLDDALLPGTLFPAAAPETTEKTAVPGSDAFAPSCADFRFGVLFFCVTQRPALALQLVGAAPCPAPRLLYTLWNEHEGGALHWGDAWGGFLDVLLTTYCNTSEVSLHIISVCSLLSMLPSWHALLLLSSALVTQMVDVKQLPLSWDLPVVRPSPAYVCVAGTCGRDMPHVLAPLLREFLEPGKLLSVHAAKEIMKVMAGRPETVAPRLTLEASLKSVYESGKKLHLLGKALWESVRLLVLDQSQVSRELEEQCRQELSKCLEKTAGTTTHHVSLSSTICDICGDLLTHHEPVANLLPLETAALKGKVCALDCRHRYHALCLRSLAICLANQD